MKIFVLAMLLLTNLFTLTAHAASGARQRLFDAQRVFEPMPICATIIPAMLSGPITQEQYQSHVKKEALSFRENVLQHQYRKLRAALPPHYPGVLTSIIMAYSSCTVEPVELPSPAVLGAQKHVLGCSGTNTFLLSNNDAIEVFDATQQKIIAQKSRKELFPSLEPQHHSLTMLPRIPTTTTAVCLYTQANWVRQAVQLDNNLTVQPESPLPACFSVHLIGNNPSGLHPSHRYYVANHHNGTPVLHTLRERIEIPRTQQLSYGYECTFSPDGSLLVDVSCLDPEGYSIKIYAFDTTNPGRLQLQQTIPYDDNNECEPGSNTCFSPNNLHLAVGSSQQKTYLYSRTNTLQPFTTSPIVVLGTKPRFNPNSTILMTHIAKSERYAPLIKNTVMLYDSTTGEEIQKIDDTTYAHFSDDYLLCSTLKALPGNLTTEESHRLYKLALPPVAPSPAGAHAATTPSTHGAAAVPLLPAPASAPVTLAYDEGDALAASLHADRTLGVPLPLFPTPRRIDTSATTTSRGIDIATSVARAALQHISKNKPRFRHF